MAAFTTKSGSQSSPFTAGHRSKSGGAFIRPHTINSNVMLSTLGSIPQDMDLDGDIEQDVVEMSDMHVGLGTDNSVLRGSTSTRTIISDAAAGMEGEGESPAPAYQTLEMGFRSRGPSLDGDMNRIRVDVEQTTSTI
jgi:hypothetical protein